MKKEYQSPCTNRIQVEGTILCVSTGGGANSDLTPDYGEW